MRYRDDQPVLFDEPEHGSSSVVTLIRSVPREPGDGPSSFDVAMSQAWKFVRNTVLMVAAIVAIGAYPAMTLRAHQLDDSLPDLSTGSAAWTDPTTGFAHAVIGREIDGSGWIADKPGWRPEARLTALPAWQTGLSTSLSELMRLRAETAPWEGEPDNDLMRASRLLSVRDDGQMQARLLGAREALSRYDGRLLRGLAASASTPEAVQAELALVAGWAKANEADLRAQIADTDRIFARYSAIEAAYTVRARGQVASLVIAGILATPVTDPWPAEVRASGEQALTAWREVAEVSPLFIANANPGSFFPGNHLISLSYLSREAEAATLAFATALATMDTSPRVIVAEADAAAVDDQFGPSLKPVAPASR